jgi:hypothetical protein
MGRGPEGGAAIAGLRGQLWEAAATTRRLRRLVLGMMLTLLLGSVVVAGMTEQPRHRRGADFVHAAASVYVPVSLLGLALAPLYAAGYRYARRRQLRRRLAALAPEQARAVLLPLRDQGGDLSRMVEPLLRDLRLDGSLLLPVDAPPGRGSEPSPAPPGVARVTSALKRSRRGRAPSGNRPGPLPWRGGVTGSRWRANPWHAGGGGTAGW